MATSSIKKNFVISGQKQVEMFVDAIEARFVSSDDELIEFLNKREKANVGK